MSEASEAKRDGARLQRNSGRGQYSKGDALWRGYVVDYKEYSKGFTINRDNWGKACMDAIKVGFDKEPLIKVVLGDDKDKVRLATLAWDRLEELEDQAEELEEYKRRYGELEN